MEDAVKSGCEGIADCAEVRQGASRLLVSGVSLDGSYVFYNVSYIFYWFIGVNLINLLRLTHRKFVSEKLPELRMLNQLTFFSIEELNDKFETPSAVHVLYGDRKS